MTNRWNSGKHKRYTHWSEEPWCLRESHWIISAWQACNIASLASHQPQRFLPFALHVTEQRGGQSQRFPYRQVKTVVVTVVNGSYDPRPPWPPTNVANFRRLVPADTEEPFPDQLRPSLDCHGPALVKTPPRKNFPTTTPLQTCHLRH